MACVTSSGVRTAGPPLAAGAPAEPNDIGDDGIMALVVGGGSGTEVDDSGTEVEATIGGVEEVGRGSDIEPESSDTRLIGSCSLCLVYWRL